MKFNKDPFFVNMLKRKSGAIKQKRFELIDKMYKEEIEDYFKGINDDEVMFFDAKLFKKE